MNKINSYFLIAIAIISFLFSCKKETITPKPILLNAVIDSVTQSKAYIKVAITNTEGSEISAKGVCWGKEPDPTTNDEHTNELTSSDNFNSEITNLLSNTVYHVRSYVTSNELTTYSKDTSFILWLNEPGPEIMDIDGNIYGSVKIGSQIWMTENLKTTKFNDGVIIPYDSTGLLITQATACYCWYNNNETDSKSIYGALYSWTAVNSGKLSPPGWHVPTFNDWLKLKNYLEGAPSGGKLKSPGTDYWLSPNLGATNESGFNAMPGGYRISSGYFYNIGYEGNWWTSSKEEGSDYYVYYISLRSDAILMHHDIIAKDNNIFSVRCLKD